MEFQVWWMKIWSGKMEVYPFEILSKRRNKALVEAKELIDELIKMALQDDDGTYNDFGLEVLRNNDWVEYSDKEGRDIIEIMEQDIT